MERGFCMFTERYMEPTGENQVAVNVEQVRYVISYGQNVCSLYFDKEQVLNVRGTLDHVITKLRDADN